MKGRRAIALAALAATGMGGSIAAPSTGKKTPPGGVVLATPQQLAADHMLARLAADPDVLAEKAKLRAELQADPLAATPEGAASLNHALDLWTASLILGRTGADVSRPQFLWTDDEPHRWRSLSVPGAGLPGDNPDAIYRSAQIDGGQRYLITGKVPPNPPSQYSFEVMRGSTDHVTLQNQSKSHADMGGHVSIISSPDIHLEKDGSFRIELGDGAGENSSNHLALSPGNLIVVSRNMLSDWRQQPVELSIHRIDAGGAVSPPLRTIDDLRQDVLQRLPGFVHFWAHYRTTWLGGLQANGFAGPVSRDGGWGYIVGGRYDLTSDEALLLTIDRGGARYTGVQITDSWMMTVDSVQRQGSLNLAQSRANPDGSYTYVIAPEDPGAANWLDSGGLHHGYVLVRWQALPPGTKGEGLLRDFRVVKLSAVSGLVAAPRVTPAERRALLADRLKTYRGRVSVRRRIL